MAILSSYQCNSDIGSMVSNSSMVINDKNQDSLKFDEDFHNILKCQAKKDTATEKSDTIFKDTN